MELNPICVLFYSAYFLVVRKNEQIRYKSLKRHIPIGNLISGRGKKIGVHIYILQNSSSFQSRTWA